MTCFRASTSSGRCTDASGSRRRRSKPRSTSSARTGFSTRVTSRTRRACRPVRPPPRSRPGIHRRGVERHPRGIAAQDSPRQRRRPLPSRLTFGVCAYDVSSADLVDIAQAAEAAGFDSLWLGEHVLLPQQYRSAHPTHSGAVDESDTRLSENRRGVDAAARPADSPRRGRGDDDPPPAWHRHLPAALTPPAAHRPGRAHAQRDRRGALHARRGGRVVGGGVRRVASAVPGAGEPPRGGDRGPAGRVPPADPSSTTALTSRPARCRSRRLRSGFPSSWVAIACRRSGRAARLGDAWFASGNPSLEDAVDLDRRLQEFRIEAGRPEPLECYVRVGEFDPDQVERYVAAGLNNLIFWAQDICPAGADRGRAFASAARRLGIEPPA